MGSWSDCRDCRISYDDGCYAECPLCVKDKRLSGIAEIIESVDNRCMAADGPVTPTLQEMDQAEISEIYQLAKGVVS